MTAVRFEEAWQAFDGIFGGYVVARLVQACAVDGYLPLSISVQFMGAVRPGAGELHTTVTHRGSLTAAVEATVVQQHVRASAVVKLGRQPPERIIDRRQEFAGAAGAQDIRPAVLPYGPYPYEQLLESRMAPPPGNCGTERMCGWVRMHPMAGVMARCAAVCILLDTPPPGPFFLDRAPAFVPTVDFTAHFAPAVGWDPSEWTYVSRGTHWATQDFCLEEASIYTADGALVAGARQTRRIVWASEQTRGSEHRDNDDRT